MTQTVSRQNPHICHFHRYTTMTFFILEDPLSVQTDMLLWPFLYQGLIIRLDELGQTFVVRMVMRLKYKDGHKTHYASGRTFLRNTS